MPISGESCLAHQDRLTESASHVEIDAAITPGSLAYGEHHLSGEPIR